MRFDITKKGEITIAWIVTIVLLVLGFLILLLFYYNIRPLDTVDKEACHESVVLRGSLPRIAENYIPLKCKTGKICIAAGGLTKTFNKVECEDFVGEKGITTIKVTGIQDIEKVFAQEILDCWSMMGEGKLSLFPKFLAESFGAGGVYPTCSVCSRIAFDKNLFSDLKINQDDINVEEYMMTHKISGKKKTYFEYILGESAGYSIAQNLQNVGFTNSDPSQSGVTGAAPEIGNNVDLIDTEQNKINLIQESIAILYMEISAPKHGDTFWNFINSNLGFLGFKATTKPSSFLQTYTTKNAIARNSLGQFKPGSGKLVSKVGLSSFIKRYIAVAIITLGLQQANVYWQRSITAGKCQDIMAGAEARDGCSAVRMIPYDVADISTYCEAIESIP